MLGEHEHEALERIEGSLHELHRKVDLMSDQQTELAADLVTLEGLVTTINTTATAIAAEIATLQAANPELDLSGVTTLISNLTGASTGLAALVPAPPAPAPVPVQAFDPGTNLALYSYAGTAAPLSPPWTAVTDVTGPGSEVLYTYDADVAGAAPTGAVGEWVPFTGALTVA